MKKGLLGRLVIKHHTGMVCLVHEQRLLLKAKKMRMRYTQWGTWFYKDDTASYLMTDFTQPWSPDMVWAVTTLN